MNERGALFLVPNTLDFGVDSTAPLSAVLPEYTLNKAARIRYWIGEEAKSTRAFLKRLGTLQPLCVSLQEMDIQSLPREVHKKGDHLGSRFDAKPLLAAALAGHDVGLISEAGMPAVADPGSSVVRAAHALGIEVVPLVGPVSLLLALAASGLNGQNFAFVGYLPQDAQERAQRLRDLEKLAYATGQTQLFIETPYRNAALHEALLQTLKPGTRLAISSGLTLPQAHTRSCTIGQWRERPGSLDRHLPAVFAIGV